MRPPEPKEHYLNLPPTKRAILLCTLKPLCVYMCFIAKALPVPFWKTGSSSVHVSTCQYMGFYWLKSISFPFWQRNLKSIKWRGKRRCNCAPVFPFLIAHIIIIWKKIGFFIIQTINCVCRGIKKSELAQIKDVYQQVAKILEWEILILSNKLTVF